MVMVWIVLHIKAGIDVEVVRVTMESCYARKIVVTPSCGLYSFSDVRDGLF